MTQGKARRFVYARSGGQCEVRILGVCLGRATNWHHRINRSQGGLWLPSNGLHVCGSGTHGCHGALTVPQGRRAEFNGLGWTIAPHYERGQLSRVLVPAARFPVYRWQAHAFGPEWVFLDDEGGITPIGFDDLHAVLAEFGLGRVA